MYLPLVCKGDPDDVMQELQDKVDEYTGNVSADYIGTSSGDNRAKAMKRRHDNYKKENNIDTMVAIYESNNEGDCRKVEKELLEYRGIGNGTNINRTGGGGGRNSKGPKYQVYIATST